MKTKGFFLLLGLAALLAAGGCWDYQELDGLAIAAGAALDLGDQGQKIFTAQLADLQKPETVEAKLTAGQGAGYLEAGRQAGAQTGRRLYFGHAQTVVVSQRIARQDIRPVLDYISRQNDSLLSLRLMVSRQQTAAEIFQAQPQSESLSGFELSLRASEKGQSGLDMPFFRFYSEMQEPGIDSFLPAVSAPEGGEGGARIDGAALFQGPRLRAFLDGPQTETLMLLRGMEPHSPLTLERPESQGGDAALTLRDCRLKLRAGADQGRPWARLELTAEAAVGELAGSQNLMAEQQREELERQCAGQLEDRARQLIALLQREQCDTLGIGLTLSRRCPKEWDSLRQDWYHHFSGMPIQVQVTVTVTGAGRMYLPVRLEEEENHG